MKPAYVEWGGPTKYGQWFVQGMLGGGRVIAAPTYYESRAQAKARAQLIAITNGVKVVKRNKES